MELDQLLNDSHPELELTYMGSGYNLDVFRVYYRGSSKEIGQLRVRDNWHLLRFDLPETIPSSCPLVVKEDEDGNSWAVPGWNTIQGFLDSFQEYPNANSN